MADWSHLPQELLHQIAQALETHFDILHFRAVCSSWRASVPYNLLPPPSYSRLLKLILEDEDGEKSSTFVLQRPISIFKFHGLHNQRIPHFWLVKLEEDDESGQIHILNPLSSSKMKPQYPKVLDISTLEVQELALEYIIQGTDYAGTTTAKAAYWFPNPKDDCQRYVVFIEAGDLYLFKFGDEEATKIEEEGSWSPFYDDFIQFKGKFYAVDNMGTTIAVEPCSRTATPVTGKLTFSGEKKFLVQSFGKLLLVDIFRASKSIYGDPYGKTLWFQVFQLDEERKRWDLVKSLGDRILFLGKYCNFSASRIPGVQGNCIVFSNEAVDEYGELKGDAVYVFQMRNQRVIPLQDFDGYLYLFRPPLL
ncbi:hypothetical protein SLEP1_g33617 [Rubroshorea leprosula]|uniref:F-box protein n=1 Tax=Rubroshorea leprosula TaxID=152421 RepID=A0AAV5KH67_9ROSI|nr:hypothetical protein SLEP1_g33617 [Rubroshorea leprosula]